MLAESDWHSFTPAVAMRLDEFNQLTNKRIWEFCRLRYEYRIFIERGEGLFYRISLDSFHSFPAFTTPRGILIEYNSCILE